MGRNTSISLGNNFEDVINEALEAGEKSRFIDDFDPKEHLKKLQAPKMH
ncbi:hypothetical protein LB467_12905 [Salegentibacter sp. JZCK2]|nr:hypothetical protein [Salegentibacter tibetensis]MBZ9730587.1 hypothetical protein [Salegentibacter tibetensis]